MNAVGALDRIRIVLTRTSHPGNIGAAARAMKTMGLSRLYLIEPASFPDPVAVARASGADDILDAAVVVGSLDEALQGTILAAAVTARRRERSVAPRSAREGAIELLAHVDGGDVALVFGTEATGLTNEEVERCSMPVSIPANPGYSSLNLGAAVQLLCYELRMAAITPPPLVNTASNLASFDEVEGFYGHLEDAMVRSGFYDPANPKRLMQRLRRLFGRTRLEKEEVNILRGIIAAFERKVD
ncbi:RNA methyltransferase [Azoarcus sp. KH32C]|uniref:RNA methyltransferase n=1 Tax=Azoarcus sp. KH32C TaxID=748247 RepID=UPI000238617C|nr:RNA methyltransferase [Azoarcus sp. KH32C]BAL25125.1 RNA methyltransferase [Azoarcus sp. KH32C]